MLYDSQIKKVLKTLQQENKNTVDIEKINNRDKLLTPENFTKPLVVLHLIVGYNFQFGIFDLTANNGKGGYINNIVNITYGGPNQVNVPPPGPPVVG